MKWKHLIFNLIIYVVQLYKEECAILQICRAVRSCLPEQQFQVYSAQTFEEFSRVRDTTFPVLTILS